MSIASVSPLSADASNLISQIAALLFLVPRGSGFGHDASSLSALASAGSPLSFGGASSLGVSDPFRSAIQAIAGSGVMGRAASAIGDFVSGSGAAAVVGNFISGSGTG